MVIFLSAATKSPTCRSARVTSEVTWQNDHRVADATGAACMLKWMDLWFGFDMFWSEIYNKPQIA